MQKSIPARQIALFSACVLPVYKMLELPSLLARRTNGDLWLPALLQLALQFALLCAVLYAVKRGEGTLLSRMQAKLGKGLYAVYGLYAVFYLFYAVLPILDLEKFTYAVFYDTAPTSFSFGFFFLLLAFVGCKRLKTVGRFGDGALFIFPIAFFALIVMAFSACDLSSLLPVAKTPVQDVVSAVRYTAMPFCDVALLLPLVLRLEYQKGDGKKIAVGYGVGAICSLLFLVVFYGVFSTSAGREHYAFSKIAQYFPALDVVGRVDLLFVYLLCILAFFYACVPFLYTVRCVKRLAPKFSPCLSSGILAVVAFVFTLFCNKYYDAIYSLFGYRLYPVFWVFGFILPLLLLFFTGGKKRATNAST
ncbi:MAG: GerAB/ArcD/ProY family transporter [Clostridia bacterium]|nr:GerAB/ArcD/ProY family transporter [Clostridia bacterium]